MIGFVDIITDLQFGDSGKGAVCYELSKRPEYDMVMRVNGGSNAGHTIYHKGKKFATHLIPTGIFHGKTCIIGPGCVVNPKKFFEELASLEALGVATEGKIFIARNAHLVTEEHIASEASESAIGTTKQGIGPAVSAKYARTGVRAESCPELAPYVIDLYDFLYLQDPPVNWDFESRIDGWGILCEGAQGFGLDIDWCEEYPFCTSSHASVAGALLNGLPWNKVRHVYGIAKVYETYVGAKSFEPKDPIFGELRELGQEYGATTGRPRQCNWLRLGPLLRAAQINAVTHLVFSKLDVLRALNVKHENRYWNFLETDSTVNAVGSESQFKRDIDRYFDCAVIWRNSPTDPVVP